MKNLCLLLAVVCAAVVLAACMDVLFDEDIGGSSSKKASLTAVTLSTGSAGDITDGFFDNGTRSRVVNLPAGTQSVMVAVEAEYGADVVCNGSETPLTLTLESGLTMLTIDVMKNGKSPSTYTLLFSVAGGGGG
ncbi:MAG: hypothetical protein LBG74_04800 [Spirochaetaceae bacterium]|jgi:hypothetical protein|nr:hypothetical protein [Spirochaetaceae bacterium]